MSTATVAAVSVVPRGCGYPLTPVHACGVASVDGLWWAHWQRRRNVARAAVALGSVLPGCTGHPFAVVGTTADVGRCRGAIRAPSAFWSVLTRCVRHPLAPAHASPVACRRRRNVLHACRAILTFWSIWPRRSWDPLAPVHTASIPTVDGRCRVVSKAAMTFWRILPGRWRNPPTPAQTGGICRAWWQGDRPLSGAAVTVRSILP